MDINDILKTAVDRGASDIILTVGKPVTFRIRGQCVGDELFPKALTADDTEQLTRDTMNASQAQILDEQLEVDFSFARGSMGRFRANVFTQSNTKAAVIRTISDSIKSLAELGMPDVLYDLAARPRGLLLITGPTGSGKSTTLAAVIDDINSKRAAHILTIEDPVEVVHRHKRSVIEQREIGRDTKSFQKALKSALRQAPDVILVGEMRDYETISAAITAAETGHLVMGTLHTNTAPQTIDRIIDVMPEAQQAQVRVQLAESIVGVVTQTLLPRIDQPGRAIAYEIMVATPAIKALIREGKTNQIISEMQTGAELGMITFDKVLASLVTGGTISIETALEKCIDPKALKSFIEAGGGVRRSVMTDEPKQAPGRGRFG